MEKCSYSLETTALLIFWVTLFSFFSRNTLLTSGLKLIGNSKMAGHGNLAFNAVTSELADTGVYDSRFL
jgi:hypothetical protein